MVYILEDVWWNAKTTDALWNYYNKMILYGERVSIDLKKKDSDKYIKLFHWESNLEDLAS